MGKADLAGDQMLSRARRWTRRSLHAGRDEGHRDRHQDQPAHPDKVERAFVDPREMQYLYNDGTGYIFMDKENYEQLTLSEDMLEGQNGYLLPNTDVRVMFYNDKPIGVELPPSVVLTVTETDPNIRNATVTTSFKPAKTETGLIVQVPPFVNSGEKIKVNTDDGAYIERV
jgi:elongation factor P